MERRKVVICGVLSLLGLFSAVTAFAAEATRIKKSQVKITSSSNSTKQCSYPRSPAFDLGFTSALFLVMAQIIVSVASGCLCCRKGPAPSTSKWIISLICFIASWFTFIIAFLLLLTGAALNDEHKEETMTTSYFSCYIVKPGVFSTGSVLSVVTVILGIVYYLCLNSSKQTTMAANQGGGIAMGRPQIPERVEDPVFVHEDTYVRRQIT